MASDGAAMALKLIMFDFDGTLVDSQRVIVSAMTEAFAAFDRPSPPLEAVRRVVGLHLEQAVAGLAPDAAADEVAGLAARYREAFHALRGRDDFDEPLFPGMRGLIEALEHPEILLGIATGKNRRGLLHSLERHGLRRHFATLKTADDGPGKPHPEILDRAMAEMGVTPGETVMVGDTVFDMQLAVNAGVRPIGVSWGYHGPEELWEAGAGDVVDDPAGLRAALERDRTAAPAGP